MKLSNAPRPETGLDRAWKARVSVRYSPRPDWTNLAPCSPQEDSPGFALKDQIARGRSKIGPVSITIIGPIADRRGLPFRRHASNQIPLDDDDTKALSRPNAFICYTTKAFRLNLSG